MTMQTGGFEFLRPAEAGPRSMGGDAPASSSRAKALPGMVSGEKGGGSFAAALTDEISRKDPHGRPVAIHPDELSIKEGELPEGLSRLLSLADRLADSSPGERPEVPAGTVAPAAETNPSPEEVPVDGPARKVPTPQAGAPVGSNAEALGSTGDRPVEGQPAGRIDRPLPAKSSSSEARIAGVGERIPVREDHFRNSGGAPRSVEAQPVARAVGPVEARPHNARPAEGGNRSVPAEARPVSTQAAAAIDPSRSAEARPVSTQATAAIDPSRSAEARPVRAGERIPDGQRPAVRPEGTSRPSAGAPERTLGETMPRSAAEPVARAVGPVEARPHAARPAEGGNRPVRAEERIPDGQRPAVRSEGTSRPVAGAPERTLGETMPRSSAEPVARAANAGERIPDGLLPARREGPVETRVPNGRAAEAPAPPRQAVDAAERPLPPQSRPLPTRGGSSENADPARPVLMTSRPSTAANPADTPAREVLSGTRTEEGSREVRPEREPAAPSGKAIPRESSRAIPTSERLPSPRPDTPVHTREFSSGNSPDRTGGEPRPTPTFGEARELSGNGNREARASTATPPLREMAAAPPAPPPATNTPSQPAPLPQESARLNGMAATNQPGSEGDSSSSDREKRERRTPQLERAEKAGQTQPGPASPAGKGPLAVQRVGYVSEIFSRSLESIERILEHQSSNRVQLSFKTESGDDMKVFLKYANGLLQSTFVTDSDSLRVALREGWMQFQRQLAERGVDAHQPDFRHDSGDPGRGSQREEEAPDKEGPFGSRSSVANRGAVGRQQQPVVAVPPAEAASSARPHLNTYA